jgi:two-component system, NtrC family, response regulator HydG
MTSAHSHSRSRLLIVDDDAEVRDALSLFFSDQGHECELADDGVSALQVVERMNLDAVICDVRMDGMSGFELLDLVKQTHPALPFIVLTGRGEGRDAADAIRRGAFQYVTKPCNMDGLRSIVAGAIEARRQHVDVDGRRRPSPPTVPPFELLGDGPAMQSLQARIDLAARSSAPVVITGETGAGKELVARAIHARGARRHGPFVAVNSAAIPQDLLEAEVFGHVRGAFTGALQPRKGLMMEAHGGTLLLDEIGEMPVSLQAKLLRVLQFGEVRPVGGDRPHRVDVRVVASTHRDLRALVQEKRFREDLYFRLNVLPLVVPPLRERPEDIPTLATQFLAQARARTPHSPVRSIGEDAIRALRTAPWPGNVRELASVIERAVVFGSDEQITARTLPMAPSSSTDASAVAWPFSNELPWTLRRLSRAYADWVLVQTGGNKERAAELLGIDLSTLYRWQRSRQD